MIEYDLLRPVYILAAIFTPARISKTAVKSPQIAAKKSRVNEPIELTGKS